MDSGARITITIKPRYIERAIYWVVIVILAVLLVLSYLDDTGPDKPAEEEAPVVNSTPEPEEPEETCSDGIMNQDETDVDCGGSCPGCRSGYSCSTAADCAGDYCVAGECTNEEPVTLSGDVDLAVTGVETEIFETTGAVRVTGVSLSVENGLEEDLGPINVRVYLKSKRDATYCLNQQEGEEFDCPTPYATFTLTGPDSGETITRTVDLEGKYMGGSYVSNFGSSTYYENGDEFNLFLYIFDDSGTQIDGRSISAFRSVSP